MTQVYIHPEIEDHFVEYDFKALMASPSDGSVNDLRRKLMQDYTSEKCVLLRNVSVDYDRDFVNAIHFPHNWAFKKFKSRTVEAPTALSEDPEKQEICRDLFGGDAGKYQYFEGELKRVNMSIRQALDEILRSYNIIKKDIIWRHTETRVENLHFDIDKDAGEFESVRLYYNMDSVPRIWHTTHGLRKLIAHYYEDLHMQDLKGEKLERLLHILSVRLFGSWQTRGREQFPRHMVMFEPNDVWVVDGRTVPHQVIYGRRVASTFYRLDPKAMPPWHHMLGEEIAQMHDAEFRKRYAGSMAYDMRGLVYPFGNDGPPAKPDAPRTNLKADWADIYAQSIQQQLVRL